MKLMLTQDFLLSLSNLVVLILFCWYKYGHVAYLSDGTAHLLSNAVWSSNFAVGCDITDAKRIISKTVWYSLIRIECKKKM